MASEVVEREGKSYWGMGGRACDSCRSSPALLFCRADSAFLCSACDGKVHGANKLASRHERVWICEVCEQAPAAVTCKADAAALCVSCDSDIHSANPLARRHDRVPVVPFFDSSPTKVPKSAHEGYELEDDEEAEAESWIQPKEAEPTKISSSFYTDVDPYLDLDYSTSLDSRFHQDSVVPVEPARGVAVGFGCGIGLAAVHHHHPPTTYIPTVPEHSFSYPASLTHSVSSSDVGVVPDGSPMADISNPYGRGACNHAAATAAMGMDREARVLRYREKRKNRRFEKTIRYASRKAYAETRPRIKGRFAKRTEMEGEGDIIVDDTAAELIIDPGYGVVPSF